VAILPDGQRRRDIETAARDVLALFAGRTLPFDRAAAGAYAEIVAERRQIGRPINDIDAQIAAITRSRGMALATRNGFEGTGVQVIDPWTA
jgi:predicted nucleic acid-binding protein